MAGRPGPVGAEPDGDVPRGGNCQHGDCHERQANLSCRSPCSREASPAELTDKPSGLAEERLLHRIHPVWSLQQISEPDPAEDNHERANEADWSFAEYGQSEQAAGQQGPGKTDGGPTAGLV